MTRRSFVAALAAAFAVLWPALPAQAQRQPVLHQIAVPHDYYFREMYLPQLTSGPGSLAWSPDGSELVYSTQGSLWRQVPGAGTATQLTAGPGYDYQPDWSPDGERIVFVRYLDDAMELYVLSLATGATTRLTGEAAVNVDPRWSPDGRRIAFVSTRDTGRFKVYLGEWAEGGFTARMLVPDRESRTPRYYYSTFDHELSPSWSPSGDALLYVSNPEIPYGTGALYRHPLTGDGKPALVRKEETTWKARPDWSPDGKRIVYASYLGRQWHQLWLTTPQGEAEPFPLTYGDFDGTAPRWSPDGSRIAYIANASGSTEIRIIDTVGGRTVTLPAADKTYLAPQAVLDLEILDAAGRPVTARVAVRAADGRSYAPEGRWIHADDGFDRAHAAFETQYFHSQGNERLSLPSGPVQVTVWHGPEHAIEQRRIEVEAGSENRLQVRLQRLAMPAQWAGWTGGDVHVHMNYGGTYRNSPARLVAQAKAEDLAVVFNLIVNKEQRIPDIAYFSPRPDTASRETVLLLHAQEFHTGFWGHLGLLGLNSHLLLPDYSAYPGTAAASVFPDNVTVARQARAQGALVGYVHPFLSPPPDPQEDKVLSNALPVDAALGLVDYYEVVGFADHRASAEVWYRLMNCGIRIAAAGGTDAMANYASLRGPVGVNRVYVPAGAGGGDTAQRRDAWLAGLKAGQSMATNGPLLGLTVNGQGPGGEVRLDQGGGTVRYQGFLRSAVQVDHLELVYNGKVVAELATDKSRRAADFSGTLPVTDSGWLLVRAWNDSSDPLVFDLYPYATTSPVYVSAGGVRSRSGTDAEYFLAWIARIRDAAGNYPDYNTGAERAAVLSSLDQAQAVYESCR